MAMMPKAFPGFLILELWLTLSSDLLRIVLSFITGFNQFDCVVPQCSCVHVSWLGFHGASWICEFMVFIKFRNILAIIFYALKDFQVRMRLFDIFQSLLTLYSFFFNLCSFLIEFSRVSIVISSDSITFFSVTSYMLFILSSGNLIWIIFVSSMFLHNMLTIFSFFLNIVLITFTAFFY